MSGKAALAASFRRYDGRGAASECLARCEAHGAWIAVAGTGRM